MEEDGFLRRNGNNNLLVGAAVAAAASTVLNVDTQTRHQAVAANDRIKEPAEGVISISSKEPSWLSIRNGEGKVIFEGTLSESRSLPAQPDLEIYAGRPDLVLVSRGEDAPKALGPINQVRWYRLSPEL